MKNTKRGFLFTIIATTSWGISGVLGDYIMNHFSILPQWLTSVRMLSAGIILLFITYLKEKKLYLSIFKNIKSATTLIAFSVFGLVFIQYAFLQAILYTNGGTATVLQYLGPIFILIYLCFRDRRLPKINESLALAFAMLGTFFLATHGKLTELVLSPVGLAWGLFTAVCTILYVLLPEKLLREYGTLPVIGWGMLIGGIIFTIFMNPFATMPVLTSSSIFFVILLIVFGTAIPYALYLEGVLLIGPVKTGMLAAIEPVSAVICTAIFLHVPFQAMDLLGIACILVAVYVLERK